jgi:hypothetical protein
MIESEALDSDAKASAAREAASIELARLKARPERRGRWGFTRFNA